MQGQDAVSPVIGTLLLLAVFTVVTATTVFVVVPSLQEYQDRGEVDSVVAQLGQINAEIKQLAVSGNVGQVTQKSLSLPGGDLRLAAPHVVALTFDYYDHNYSAAEGVSKDPDWHFDFYVEPSDLDAVPGLQDYGPDVDPSDPFVNITYRHEYYESNALTATAYTAYFDGEVWVDANVVAAPAMAGMSVALPLMTLGVPTLGSPEGPWRIQIRNETAGPDPVLAEIYLFVQPSLEFRYAGESGLHKAAVEGGALFRQERDDWSLIAPSFFLPPASGGDGGLFTLRSLDINSTAGDSASGHTRLGVLLNLNLSETFLFNGGAAEVRLQFWGSYPLAWEEHLKARGFQDDHAADTDGVSWADRRTVSSNTFHDAFPVHYAHSRIDVRFRST